jgi:hypothetical protein
LATGGQYESNSHAQLEKTIHMCFGVNEAPGGAVRQTVGIHGGVPCFTTKVALTVISPPERLALVFVALEMNRMT